MSSRRVTATKIELIKIRRSMQVAKMVHKILDDKREVLLKKIDEMIEEANKARDDIWHGQEPEARLKAVDDKVNAELEKLGFFSQ